MHQSGKRLSMYWLVLVSGVFVIAALAFTYGDDAIPTGPFTFIYPANFGNRINVPADNPTTKPGVYLGRLLFYETRLSANNKLSCSSCHQQQLAFTDGKAFSEGVDHSLTPRNAMSLTNLLWARKFFWDARASGLEAQAEIPMTNPHEMGQSLALSAQKIRKTPTYPGYFKAAFGDEKITGQRITMAIAQFERTLISANSHYDQYLRNTYQPTADELRGMALFNAAPQPERSIRGGNCAHCHGGAKNYMELFHNNGLDNIPADAGIGALTGLAGDQGRFKVPTLRNIALTAPYMHDGRFKTLTEVLDHYSDHVKQSAALSSVFRNETNEVGGKTLNLLPLEKKQIIAFLNMLTDESFIHNPDFANPHLITAKK